MSINIVTAVRTILNDSGVFWPTQTVLDAINEAQFHIYAETKWAITTATFSVGNGVDIIQIPSAILIPKWLEGTNSNFQPPVRKRFFFTTMRNLEHFLRTWRGRNLGQPVYFILWDATHWRVFPRPDSEGSNSDGSYPFTVFGVGYPNEVVESPPGSGVFNDVYGPPNYVMAIQNYSASLLLEATRPDLADMYMAQAMEQLLAFKKQLRNQQSHNIRTLKPATTRYEIDQAGEVYQLPTYYPLES